ACSIPPYDSSPKVIKKIKTEVNKVISNMEIIGLVNVQLAYVNDQVYLLEVNPRASRTIPFVSKALGIPLARIAAKIMAGKKLKELGFDKVPELKRYCVKEAVLPFNKFQNVDPILGPEMRSTGEVMGIGASFAEAFEKAEIAAGVEIPKNGSVFISVRDTDKQFLSEIVTSLNEEGFELIATKGTASVIKEMGFKVKPIKKVLEGRPNIIDLMKNNDVNLVINTTEGRESIQDSSSIRRTALDQKICCTTTIQGAKAICEVLSKKVDWTYQKLQDMN
ncbi:ATP-grasp domain-containing protein, partial [SAR86 cluster bacterium]|nr:ATP-grasp domain-containing protein [SAR86 cluster bacterium]